MGLPRKETSETAGFLFSYSGTLIGTEAFYKTSGFLNEQRHASKNAVQL